MGLSGGCLPWNCSTSDPETAAATRRVPSELPTLHTKEVSDPTSKVASSIRFETSINRLSYKEEESWRSLISSLCLGSPASTFPPAAHHPVTQLTMKRKLHRGKERMRDIISSQEEKWHPYNLSSVTVEPSAEINSLRFFFWPRWMK